MKNLKTFLTSLALIGLSMSSAFAQNPEYVGPRANTTHDDPANGIYVSPTGNDATATGAIDKPYKSIKTALANAPAGSTIILRGGTYQEGGEVRITRSNITIKSAKGEWAIIDLVTNYNPSGEPCGVKFYAKDSDTGDAISGGKLQSIEIMGGFYAVCIDTQWNWPVSGWGGPGASDIIIEDCILHHSTDDVIKIKPNCNNITIRYNEIHHSGQRFINDELFPTGQRNAEGIDNVNGDNMHVHHNYIHDICSTGIYAKGGATDAVIENNIVERTNAGGILVGFTTNLEYFDTDINPDYYENIRGIVHNNLIIDAGWEGIGFYASKDAQVYHNTAVNVVKGGLFHSAIYFGLADQDGAPFLGSPPNINPTIHHNIVCQAPATSNLPMIDIRYAVESGIILPCLTGMPTMNNNCYYISGKTAIFKDNRPSSLLNGNLAQWQTHISGDNGSIEVNPELNTNYMPANTACTGMGIEHPLILNPSPVGVSEIFLPLPEVSAYINNGVLHIQSAVAETVEVYSSIGALLFTFQKPEGKATYSIHQPKGTIIIIRGDSRWVKKLIVQ
jgi:hypothetical protein